MLTHQKVNGNSCTKKNIKSVIIREIFSLGNLQREYKDCNLSARAISQVIYGRETKASSHI